MSKLKFSLKRTPTERDIPIASLQVQPIDAKNVIRIDDYSDNLSANIIDINSVILSTCHREGSYTVLDMNMRDDNILVTSKTYLDENRGVYHPLWYHHSFSSAYYNKAYTSKTIRRKIRPEYIESDRVFTFLTESQSKVIIQNSVVVKVKETASSAWEVVSSNDYSIDYSARKLTVSRGAIATEINLKNPVTIYAYELSVEYSILTLDIQVQPVDKDAKYSIEVYRPVENCMGYFVVELFSDSQSPFYVIYKYANKYGEITEMKEYTSAVPVFRKVTESVFASLLSRDDTSAMFKRLFCVKEIDGTGSTYKVQISSLNDLKAYYYTSDRSNNSKIRVELPFNRKYDSEWHLTIPSSKVISYDTSDTKLTYSFISDETVVGITEKATVVGSNMIALSHINPIVSRTISGKYAGIRVVRNKMDIGIQYVDRGKGLICLSEDVSRKEVITVSYKIKRSGSEISEMCFNPMAGHSHHNGNCKKQVYGIYMIPKEYSEEKNIVLCEFNKYENARQVNYTYEKIDVNTVNATETVVRNKYRSTMDLPNDKVDFLSETTLYRLEPLAVVYLTNPLDTDGYRIDDVRTYGGGYKNPSYSCYDYSLYDGEMVDLSAKIHYTVPSWVYSDLVSRALEYDEDIAHLADKESRVDGILSTKLTALFKKYSQPGTEITYEVLK